MLTPQQISTARTSIGLSPTPTPAAVNTRLQMLQQAWGNSTPTSDTPPTSNVASETGSNYMENVAPAAQDVMGGGNIGAAASDLEKGNIASGVEHATLGTASDAVQAIFAPLAAPLQTLISHVTSGVKTPEAIKPVLDTLSSWAQAHPDIARTLSDTFNVAAGVAGSEGLNANVSDVVKGAKDSVVKAGTAVKESVVGSPEEQAAAQATKDATKQEVLKQQAVKDATPAYNKKLIGEPSVNGVPRVQEGGGITKGRTVTPTSQEMAAGEELAKVPGYADAKTSLEKYNSIEPAIVSKAQVLETSLKSEGVLRPPAELNKLVRTAVDKASSDSLLLQKTDPIVKNYLRVTQRAISQSDGTLAGEMKVRQALDAAYEDAGGKYAANKGLDQIHRAARNALNDDMEAKATNTAVKESLKQQSALYRASDVLQDKARAEGGSKLEQLMKAHPLGTKVGEMGVKAVGLGAGLHLLP